MALVDARSAVDNARTGQRHGLLGRITRRSRFYWVRVLLENWTATASCIFILCVTVAAVFAPVITTHDPQTVDPLNRLLPPSGQHWFGTDEIGRDVFSRLLFGARTSLVVGISVTAAAAIVGTTLGLIAAYYGRLDNVLMRIMDGLLAFPGVLLALAIMASLGPKTINVVIALIIVNIPRIARLARGTALVTKSEVYVEAASATGLTDRAIIWRYILPNSLSPLIVQATFVVASAIIAEASQSFLGVGVPPDVPTWGNMLRDGQRLITRSWWMSVFPGTALFLLVLAFNLIGDGIRDALDPREYDR